MSGPAARPARRDFRNGRGTGMCARRAVVLAGGGSRGAYQIGVWRAMQELGISYQIVTGTSVGALNGAMLVQGDYEPARRMWLRLTAKDIANVEDRKSVV